MSGVILDCVTLARLEVEGLLLPRACRCVLHAQHIGVGGWVGWWG